MDWTIDFVAAIALTSMTGSVFLLIWYTIGRVLDYMGYMNVLYDMLYAASLFFYIPLAYVVLHQADIHLGTLGGALFWQTDEMLSTSQKLFAIWAVGVLGVAMYQVVIGVYAHYHYKRGYSCNRSEKLCFQQVCAELGISGDRVDVIHSYRTAIPFIMGLRSPKLLLPAETYDTEMLRVIFLHELLHYKHKHLWLNRLAIGISCIHWFNPFAWWFRQLAKQWCEYDCDAKVSRIVQSLKSYILMLQQVAGECGVVFGNRVALLQTKTELLRRVERMGRYAKMKKKSKFLALLMCVVMILANSITVCAASLEAAEMYAKVYENTVVEVEETLQLENELVEYEMSGIPDGAIVEAGEARSNARGTAMYLDWGVGVGIYKRTDRFTAEAGDRITISLWIDPEDVVIRAGIQEPDGTLRYVETAGSINHTFTINKAGDYRVYVQNISTTNYVYVSGSYGVR